MKTADAQSDLLIIGSGVLGAFHAYHALRCGLTVTLLERNPAPQGATVRNFGQVVPSGLDRQWQNFGRESLEIYQAIQSQFDISMRQLGSIYLASDDEEIGLLEELQAINAADDYPSQLWTPQKCCREYPGLRSDYCRAGLFFPDEVSVNPRIMIHRLLGYLKNQPGFQSYFDSCVHDLTVTADGRTQATTTDGRSCVAERTILCCGSEFQSLYPERFRNSDLETVKLQMLRLRPQQSVSMPGNILTGLSIRRYESFSQCPSWATIKAAEPADSFAKKWGIHILFKQEADGGIILGDSHEYAKASQSSTLNFDLRSDVNDYFVTEGQRIFDLPSWEIDVAWHGIYCQTGHPSGIFKQTIDDRIHVVTGIGGKGMTSSAGFAKHHLKEIYND